MNPKVPPSLAVNMINPYEGIEKRVTADRTLRKLKVGCLMKYFMHCQGDIHDTNLHGALGYVLAIVFHTVRQVPNVGTLVAMIGHAVLTLIPEGHLFARQGFETALRLALPNPWKQWAKAVASTVSRNDGVNIQEERRVVLDMRRVNTLIVAWQDDAALEIVFPPLDRVAETFNTNRKVKSTEHKRKRL
jgi:hypothetical protein